MFMFKNVSTAFLSFII